MKQLFVFFILASLNCAQPVIDEAAIKNEISRIMEQQKQSWNRGEIDGFMAFYWNSDQFTFQSGNKRLVGWEEMMAMYRKNYAGPSMGALDFTDIQINIIDANNAYVLGRWTVTTSEATKQGLFTLVFRQFENGWRIIHDHSS
ncbi:MAG: YybH family protein [Candidatus Zhuqueibacterota bacterium]